MEIDEEMEYSQEEEEEEEDLDDDCYEDPSPSVAEQSFEVLTPKLLEERQRREITRICEVLNVNDVVASILLRHFHWNVEALMNRCFEAGCKTVLLAAGVIDDTDKAQYNASCGSNFDCKCCYDQVSYVDGTALGCGHRFCNNCWRQHFTIKVREGQAQRIRCMQRGCNVIIDESFLSQLLGHEDMIRYHKQMMEMYVEDNLRIKWCPSAPHCGNAVYAAQSSPKVVVQAHCLCGHNFCFNCTQEPHGPATCGMVKAWLAALRADGGNTSWLSQHTKDCPVCGQPVEKNGGCNLMVCRCGAYFCWICGMQTGTEHTWTEITGHTCGKYKENFNTDQAKTQLQRFQHYHDRFKANVDSAKLEVRLMETLDSRVEELQKLGDASLSSWDWLASGIRTLKECRQVLRWAYTWAYYSFGPLGSSNPYGIRLTPSARLSFKNIFEDSQEQLEYLTERLSKELEAPISGVTNSFELAQLRSTVLGMSRAATNRCKGIFDVLEKNMPREEFVEFR
eukprot:GGOE01036855.1.p1 GENE.GGOE01036855.1~~GGOE01036855.1.p1  ORF type:complete len:508 (+),score=91.69 GGOE01036855.1:95-1618(+)